MKCPLLGLGITLAGCGVPVDPGPPEFISDSRLGLWVIGPPEERQLIAFDPAEPIYPAPATLRDGWLVGLGFQGTTLGQQGLVAGSQVLRAEGRPLPTPDRRVRWTTMGWQDEDPNLAGLEALRLPPIDAAHCAAAELCLDSQLGLCEPCRPDPTAVISPTAPSPPSPLEAACPEGWGRVGPDDRPACEWAPPGPCDTGAVALPGDRACGPILASCPPGDEFPPLGPGRTLHVRDGAIGGDGSRAAPLGLLDEALAMAVVGDRIALAPGHYATSAIPAGLEVVGACAARVVLEGAPLRLLGGTLRDLSLEVPLLVTGTSTLAGIQSRRVIGAAVNVEPGAVLFARRLSIEGARDGGLVITNARATLDQVEIRSSGAISVQVGGSTVTMTRAAIDFGTQDKAFAVERGHLSLGSFSIAGASGAGIIALQSGLQLENGTVEITDGQGIFLQRGHLALRQLWLRQVPQGAVGLHLARGELSDLRVEGTPSDRTAAVRANDSRDLRVERATITGFAAGFRLVATPALLRDLVITELASSDLEQPRAVGIQANGAGPFEVERARIGGFVGHGIAMAGAGFPGQEILPSLVRVEDLEAFALTPDLEENGGVGFFEEGALRVELRRVRVVEASQRGLEIRGFPRGTDLLVQDLYVEGAVTGVERSGFGSSILERAELRKISGRGIELRGRPFLAQALRIEGGGGLRGLSLTPSDLTEELIEFRDFVITGPLGAAVVANGGVQGIRLVDGEISNVDVAFGLPEEGAAFATENVILRQGTIQRVTAVGVP